MRIADNPGLWHSAVQGVPVIPVYVLSEWKRAHAWTGANRQQFLCDSLKSLNHALDKIGGRLIFRRGLSVEQLVHLIRETSASAVYYNAAPDPFGKKEELELVKVCAQLGVGCHGFAEVALHGPDEVLTQSGSPYKVFTPYSRNWLGLANTTPLGSPNSLKTPTGVISLPLPDVGCWGLKPPTTDILEAGEEAAAKRFRSAVRSVLATYSKTRDFPAAAGTSRISQDLRHGLISIRTVCTAVKNAADRAKPSEKSAIEVFLKELAWRDFYIAILHHFPNVLDEEFNPAWRGLPWDEPGETFEAWKQGRTGFPVVDAGMRQLLATGFMHNRVRMITAMFLTKDLHLDWKLGESWFMQHLVDGEIASNNGGWQWSAGTGADAAPYFRIQNPWSQSAKYDPEGIYIKRWVPELADTPAQKFMLPPANGKPIAADYPIPCVDHQVERERTLAIFKKHRNRL